MAAPHRGEPAGRALAAARLAARALALPVAFAWDAETLRIDAGEVEIGEAARDAVSRLCARVSRSRQPLCIPHLPRTEGAAPSRSG